MHRPAVCRAAFCRGPGGTETTRALLEAGADPDAADAAGEYPALIAAGRGNAQTLALLLAAGAGAGAGEDRMFSRESILHAAAGAGPPPDRADRAGRTVQTLLAHIKARPGGQGLRPHDIRLRDALWGRDWIHAEGGTPLHVVRRCRLKPVVKAPGFSA